MAKQKVLELAQSLGIENKDLVDRLKGMGHEVTAQSLIEQDVADRVTAAVREGAPVEEERVSAGLIRRRRKAGSEGAEPPASAPEPVPAVKAKVVESPAPAKPAVDASAPVQGEVKPSGEKARVVKPVAPASHEAAESAAPAPPVAEEKPATVESKAVPGEQKPAPADTRQQPAKRREQPRVVTASQAKILGRVKLPDPPGRQEGGRYGDRPQGDRPQGGRPYGDRPQGDRPPRGDRPQGDRPPRTDRPFGDRPPRGDRPQGDRPQGGRPFGDRPQGGRPQGDRPQGARPQGDRPQGPRPAGGRRVVEPVASAEELLKGTENRKARAKTVAKKHEKDQDKRTGRVETNKRRGGKIDIFEPEFSPRMKRGKKGKEQKKTEVTLPKAAKRIIRISDTVTVGELAKRMGVKAGELIKEMMKLGSMVTINHPLDFDSAVLLASEFSYEVENVAFDEEVVLEHASIGKGEEGSGELLPRPPVVTIMGHVDHGKTSLLDAIRLSSVTAGEAGGITQHIGAYDVTLNGKQITFLDTPGHEAFTAMRSRGAQVTDIVVLVVAADDGVMPQTKEAINHAKAAGVPIIVAINKIDKPEANPERVKQELTEFALVPEEWGGETIFAEVSAKQKINLDGLLEMILLQAEVLDLKACADKKAKGIIVEARLDRGRGPVATVLVQEGTLKVGDPIVAGVHCGRVRSMLNHAGQVVEAAGPAFPVEVTGLAGVPEAGDVIHAVDDEKVAREVAQHRQQKMREAEMAKSSKISLDQLYARIKQGDVKELKVIIKGDVQGSVEAVKESLSKLSTDACRLIVIHHGVGGITESDVSLAAASDAIIVGFNIRPEPKAAGLAENEGVDIRLYNIIYDAVADVKSAMEGLLAPTLRENHLGRAEVRETFTITKAGTIAGCYVVDGKMVRNAHVRLVRDSVVVWNGKLSSLKRFKDDAREVASGYECGMSLEGYNDIKVGDMVEAYEIIEEKTLLA